MTGGSNADEAIDTLKHLGLTEYEAKCFVGLSRLTSATAKRLGEVTGVPRTRIYDAIRVLEARGLVEVQHSSPQQYRSVPLDEALETLREQFEKRVDRIENTLSEIEPIESADGSPSHEVWTITGRDAIETRTRQLIAEASDEVVFIVGQPQILTDELAEAITGNGADVDLFVEPLTDAAERAVNDVIPGATTFTSPFARLFGESDDGRPFGRLVLVDRETLLASSVVPHTDEEAAIFGRGRSNILVDLTVRLLRDDLPEGAIEDRS